MKTQISFLEPFLRGDWLLSDYLRLDDHILSSYFNHWLDEEDVLLADLANRFLTRKPFKSVLTSPEEKTELTTCHRPRTSPSGL